MTRIIGLLIAIATLLAVTSCQGNKRRYAPAEMRYQGIDVSRYQHDIDWEKVAADTCVTFAYIKATEGATHIDSNYVTNITQAHRQGIKVGAYHFFSTRSTVKAQFDNFARHIDAHHQDLIPMIDVERSGDFSRRQLIDSVAKLADMLEHRYGHKPLIYSTQDFYNDHLAPQFNKYPLYIGRYSAASPQIKWNGRALIWQYSEDGIVTGINARVDLATFTGNHTIDDILL